jgi:hypothetical protein
MQNPLMEFSNRIGNELFRVLVQRALEKLPEKSDFERLTAMMGAALIVLAEVLRGPIEEGQDAEKLIDVSSKWLREFLEPIAPKVET